MNGEELSEFPEDLRIQEFPRIGSPEWAGQGRFLF